MKTLSSALAGWQPAAARGADPLSQVRAAWPEIVGPGVAAHSRPVRLERGVLLVVTRSSAWSQQLSLLGDRILQAARASACLGVERLRFRVGRLTESRAAEPLGRRAVQRIRRDQRGETATTQDAIARFRADVTAFERAKARAGWKRCVRCGVWIQPPGRLCAPCWNTNVQERDTSVARLLYEAPWLGYDGIATLVGDLSPRDYESIRKRLLRQWRDRLERVRRNGAQIVAHDRMIASSYVLLKSKLDPERIAPAVVRDLLGDELHDLVFGTKG